MKMTNQKSSWYKLLDRQWCFGLCFCCHLLPHQISIWMVSFGAGRMISEGLGVNQLSEMHSPNRAVAHQNDGQRHSAKSTLD
jgi:hypothetical protein